MLDKLLKYEIKATGRIFLPLYLALLAYSVIHKVISYISPDRWVVPEVISMFIYVLIFVGVFVVALIVMIQRFYKNLLSDEGYLMFTLPTKPWKHIISKLLVSMMWMAISGIVAIVSICIVAADKVYSAEFIQNFTSSVSMFFEYFGASSILVIVEVLLAVIIGLASNVLIIYASIALGHLASRHRILTSFAAYIGINAASQILLTIVGIIASIPFAMDFTVPNEFFGVNSFHFIIWFTNIISGLLTAGYFILTNYVLSRHLNLE